MSSTLPREGSMIEKAQRDDPYTYKTASSHFNYITFLWLLGAERRA